MIWRRFPCRPRPVHVKRVCRACPRPFDWERDAMEDAG